ncbi:MAG: GNAT family N-acetyltransferase [Adhaeribacter sp.]
MTESITATIEIVRYEDKYQAAWDQFNHQAINGLFLFDRGYMEYHQDRFQDHSLLFFLRGQLAALLPLNLAGRRAASHGGLTFGGLLIGPRMRTHDYLQIFDQLLAYLRGLGLESLVYKPIPFIFQQQPALEDQYALFRCQARLLSRSLSSCLDLQQPLPYTKGRKWSLKRARQANLELRDSQDFRPFMALVQQILEQKYAVQPTHTAEELLHLAGKFPRNIRLLAVYQAGELIGGSAVYLSAQVVHLQYIACNEKGRQYHALDLIVHELIETYRNQKRYLSFGISPGDDAYGLNTGLIQNKESYGARSLPHDIYEIDLNVNG